jgi:hypothetical protein
MKKIVLFFNFLLIFLNIQSQNKLGSSDDAARIALAAYVPEQIDGLTPAAHSNLLNKLNQIATKNGMGASVLNNRFIITANVVVQTKDITPTAPPMHAYTLDITLYIGDGIDGTLFSNTTVSLKGVGETETKAYFNALKNLKVDDAKYQNFIDIGKKRIVEYYNSKCDFILKSAQTAAAQNNYDDAIYQLTQVPEVCKECYNKCMDAVGPLVQKQLDRDCASKLTQATTLWNANMDVYTANQVSEILSTIDPQANCFKDVKALSTKIEARVKELDSREWKMTLKAQQDEVDIQKATIKAARDIGVAYGNNQPKTITTYNIRGWW